ncbi:MAG TPA: aminotransferase class IV [Candidatus Saccharimonadales bacterium]|nr:aminotransferase class IV [Candidatus Saccharimonadales bacterium]
MAYKYFSKNGKVLPAEQAVVPLADIEYAYGFGVYETIRLSKGRLLFLGEHCERLMGSARIIGLHHSLSKESVARNVKELVDRNKADNCNVKILLIGGPAGSDATLNILCLNPLFPDRKLYKQGAHVITEWMERPFPHAKTLNMLPSYLAHRGARVAGAYDALLVNRHGYVTEGTSTNFFGLKGHTIFSPPVAEILPGVTRDKVLKVAGQNGFKIEQKDLKLDDLREYDNLFLTGTSVKIMPIRSVDALELDPPSSALRGLMKAFDDFLAFDN